MQQGRGFPGTNQIADPHAGFERIVTGHFHSAVYVYDLGGLPEVGLQTQFAHQRLNHMLATRLQIEHGNRISRQKLDVRGRAGGLKCRGKIGQSTAIVRFGGNSRRISR